VAEGVRFLIAFPAKQSIEKRIRANKNKASRPRFRVITGENEVRFRGHNN
jgi:hypothetical protein